MAEFDPNHDDSDLPDLADRDDIVWFLEQNDIPLPDRLTVEKIKSRGSWWAINEESFSFRIERHPSGSFFATSPGGRGMPTPARWHVRKQYTYDHTTGEWDVREQMREFHFDPGLLVDAEFERLPKKEIWDKAIARAEDADDPEDVLNEQLAATEDMYRSAFTTVPEEHLDEMLAVLEREFRRRAGIDLD
ncbi:hypothetical protein [Natronorubrum bangense]|uniref:Uncharacterized protein n=2 Tax=Natronorubrum bangense TaxID=61858 RepID=L9W817_9EURY|nr:hypothetical protein [Natronorubrum bangense]ELY45619.1 hypothetical protein C494_15248 [Natronorubrum bangense JCM 10635]QCC56484.1 hypothetical protein DV706_18410 [Natronorubrum bangense]